MLPDFICGFLLKVRVLRFLVPRGCFFGACLVCCFMPGSVRSVRRRCSWIAGKGLVSLSNWHFRKSWRHMLLYTQNIELRFTFFSLFARNLGRLGCVYGGQEVGAAAPFCRKGQAAERGRLGRVVTYREKGYNGGSCHLQGEGVQWGGARLKKCFQFLCLKQ